MHWPRQGVGQETNGISPRFSGGSNRTRLSANALVSRRFDAKQRHAHSHCCTPPFPIERGEWQLPPVRQFQVDGVVERDAMAVSEALRRAPDLDRRFRVQGYRKVA
jgi:hypothetical protein